MVDQFPGCQPRALQQGAGLVGKNLQGLAGFLGGVDHANGRAIAASGQAAGIAMGQDGGEIRQQRRSRLSHGAAHGHVLFAHRRCVSQQGSANVCGRRPTSDHLFSQTAATIQGPKEVHGRGPGRRQISPVGLKDGQDTRQVIAHLPAGQVPGQGQAIGRSHANGRRAPHGQLDDRPAQGGDVPAAAPGQLVRQQGLIDQDNFALIPGHHGKRKGQAGLLS